MGSAQVGPLLLFAPDVHQRAQYRQLQFIAIHALSQPQAIRKAHFFLLPRFPASLLPPFLLSHHFALLSFPHFVLMFSFFIGFGGLALTLTQESNDTSNIPMLVEHLLVMAPALELIF